MKKKNWYSIFAVALHIPPLVFNGIWWMTVKRYTAMVTKYKGPYLFADPAIKCCHESDTDLYDYVLATVQIS